jgi:hypothetical protein
MTGVEEEHTGKWQNRHRGRKRKLTKGNQKRETAYPAGGSDVETELELEPDVAVCDGAAAGVDTDGAAS